MADPALASTYWLYALMAFFATGALFFLARALRSGAVADDESPKYRMLEDGMLEDGMLEDDRPAPRAAAGVDGGCDVHQA